MNDAAGGAGIQAGGAPTAPSHLMATAISSGSIVLKWNNVNNEVGYNIERKTGECASLNPWAKIATVGADMQTFTDDGLSADTTYSYMVNAYNADGASKFLYCAQAKTGLPGTPVAPSALVVKSVSEEKVVLTWKDNADDETRFSISRKVNSENPEPWKFLASIQANSSTYTDDSALGNTSDHTYFYYVKACNDALIACTTTISHGDKIIHQHGEEFGKTDGT